MMEKMDCSIPFSPRYELVKEKAINLLETAIVFELPISVKKVSKLYNQNILFNTYSNVMKCRNISFEEVCKSYGSEDGCAIYYDDKYVIVYNDINKSDQRIRFTLAHELGHIVLGHLKYDECMYRLGEHSHRVLEIEANQFATQLLSPEPIIDCFLKYVHTINPLDISIIFNVSFSSATHVIERLNSKNSIYTYKEEELKKIFKNSIDKIISEYYFLNIE